MTKSVHRLAMTIQYTTGVVRAAMTLTSGWVEQTAHQLKIKMQPVRVGQ